jgi:hypothetical protein
MAWSGYILDLVAVTAFELGWAGLRYLRLLCRRADHSRCPAAAGDGVG